MKTTKLILVAAIMAFAMTGFSQSTKSIDVNAQKPLPTLSIEINLSGAMGNHGLVSAMHAQLNPGFLKKDQRWYRVRVFYNNVIYYVTGSYAEWKSFFHMVKTEPNER